MIRARFAARDDVAAGPERVDAAAGKLTPSSHRLNPARGDCLGPLACDVTAIRGRNVRSVRKVAAFEPSDGASRL